MSVNGPEDGPPLPAADRDLRRDGRDVPGVRHAGGAGGAAPHRAGPARGDLAAGGRHLVLRLRGGALFRHRHAAAAHRPAASRQLAVPGVRDRGRLHHRRRVAAEILRRRCARSSACRSWWPIRASLRVRRSGGEQQGAGGAAAGEAAHSNRRRTGWRRWKRRGFPPARCCISTRCSPIRRSWRARWWWRRTIRRPARSAPWA